jgi:competence protein ComEC
MISFLFLLFFNGGMFLFSKKVLLLFSLMFFFWSFFWTSLWYLQIQSISSNKHFLSSFFVAPHTQIIAKVQDIYKETEHDRVYTMKLLKLWDTSLKKNVLFRATFDKNLDIFEGDILSFESPLYPIRWEERYQMYLYQQSLYFQVFPVSFQVLWNEPPSILFRSLASFREYLLSKIEQSFPKNEALFLWGILLWARESMDRELLEDFNASWLTHIIAVSGANITIIILFCSFCFTYFPPLLRTSLLFCIIALFVLLVGLTPPVLRAACMWIVIYMVTQSGRQVQIFTLLCLVLLVFTVYNPLSPVYDISLQLSFLAVLGVIYFYPFFEKSFSFLPKFLVIRESILMTLSATITTLPLMILNFWQFSLVAPLSNLFVWWTIPLAMLGWFLSLIFSFLSVTLHQIFSFVTYLFLRYDIFMVQFFWNWQWSTLNFSLWSFSWIFFLLYYAILVFSYLYFRSEKK